MALAFVFFGLVLVGLVRVRECRMVVLVAVGRCQMRHILTRPVVVRDMKVIMSMDDVVVLVRLGHGCLLQKESGRSKPSLKARPWALVNPAGRFPL